MRTKGPASTTSRYRNPATRAFRLRGCIADSF
jgi:hypothetical protein